MIWTLLFLLIVADEKVDPTVLTWRLNEMRISKDPNKRYLDRRVVSAIWTEIDKFEAKIWSKKT